jgi:DNA polymerase-3 subunit gamma/tau
MSQAFYRKYRPKVFAEVIGQENIVKTLTNALSMGIISHGYLFSGPRGSGKTTLARLFAKALNCKLRSTKYEETKNRADIRNSDFGLQNSYEPCNQCDSCTEINEGRAIDLIEIDAASHRGIDEMRELREGIGFAPTKSKYKVFIIDESHQLTKEAFNALLKTLEEPPSHAIFILATTELHKMIPTIVSRCQHFNFRRLTIPEIVKRLEIISGKEGIKIDGPALELIALNSGGSFRDAESILDQAATFTSQLDKKETTIKIEDIRELLGIVENEKIAKIVDFLSQKQAGPAIAFLNQLFDEGADLQQLCHELIEYLHRTLIFRIGGDQLYNPLTDGLTPEEFKTMKERGAKFQEPELRKLVNLFLNAEFQMKTSPILQLPLELAIAEFCGVE